MIEFIDNNGKQRYGKLVSTSKDGETFYVLGLDEKKKRPHAIKKEQIIKRDE